jgi:hypothetical protein
MTKYQIDPRTGDQLPPFGVYGGSYQDAIDPYKKVKGGDVEEGVLYLIKANAQLNTEAHSYVQTQMYSGKVKFLIDENQAKAKLMATRRGQEMNFDQRAEELKPFVLTTILRDEMLNLVEDNEGTNIILKQVSKSIKKDKFSALEYGMYYIKEEEEKGRKRHSRNFSDFMFFN